MARRKSGIQEFLEGFNGVYNTSKKLISNIENSNIANAKPEEVVGEDGSTTYKMLGKTYDVAPTDSEQSFARNIAMAGTAKKWGDADKGMQLEGMAKQQRALDEESDIKAKTEDWYKNNSTASRYNAEFQSQLADYTQKEKVYKEQIAAGENQASLGLPPAKPVPETPTYLDTLHDTIGVLKVQADAGKPNLAAMLSAGKMLEDYKKEGLVDALRALQSGDKDLAISTFNKSGNVKIDPANVVSFSPVQMNVNGIPINTYEMGIRQPDGSVQKINAYNQLSAYDKASSIVSQSVSGANLQLSRNADARGAAAAGRAQTTFEQSQTDRKTEQAEKDAKVAAGLGIYQQQNPNATPEELAAVKTGIIAPVAKDAKITYKPPSNDVMKNFMAPMMGSDGKPVIDPIKQTPVMQVDQTKYSDFQKFQADNKITNSDEAYIKYNASQIAGREKVIKSAAAKLPKDSKAAYAQANEALQRGADRDKVIEILRAAGFSPAGLSQ